MSIPPASAVTWSMTSGGLSPFKPPHLATCRCCGEPFHSTNPTRAYCSKSCRTKQSQARRLSDRACPGCGAAFRQTWTKQVYCSSECRRESVQRLPCKPRGIQPDRALQATPMDAEGFADWCRTADFEMVDKAWVARMVEEFEDRDYTQAQISRALVGIRDRYRSAMLNAEKVKEAPSNAQAP